MRYNLSEITELIRNRRTIYPEQFSDRKIHREQIELILTNAQWAPTHGNTQPWRFVVFTDEAKQTLSDFLAKTYLEVTPVEKQNDMKLAKMLKRPLLSSAVIAVCMKRQEEEKKLKRLKRLKPLPVRYKTCISHAQHMELEDFGQPQS